MDPSHSQGVHAAFDLPDPEDPGADGSRLYVVGDPKWAVSVEDLAEAMTRSRPGWGKIKAKLGLEEDDDDDHAHGILAKEAPEPRYLTRI